ncbi:hypothetical protein [Bdellovibrio sp. NC01]|uniref:hypothetical protein n=1 Tax=Bdellovibrio sp. NC01 TaxID=2220073 RepID=UPI001159ED3E|nr:hypothetical protein [Bdellovibrio sp. NC01]QDK38276.1 hypothetical protein DOE51_12150 [Bdellovibrio sp. NC01]
MRQTFFITAALTMSLSLLSFSQDAHAQKIKVRKVQGNKAIVEFTGNLNQGSTYDLISPDEFGGEEASNNRKYVVGVNFAMTNTKADAANSVNITTFNLAARFGWNFGSFEIGPMVGYASTIADLTSTTYKLGAFADFNIIPNIPGEAFLYGIGGTGSFGQHDPGSDTVVGDYKYDLFEAFVGPFVKWFPTGGPYGFRLDAGYIYQRQSTNTIGTIAVSGFAGNFGLFAYF